MRSLLRPLSLMLLAATGLIAGKFDGSLNAPVKIDLFSDFSCPHCRELHMGSIQLLKAEYIKSGKVYLLHHDIALPQFRYSKTAALYASAAQQIGKYDEVADVLFARQADWTVSGQVDVTIAAKLTPADMKKLRALLSDKNVTAAFEADIADALRRNLQQTPTMVIQHKTRTYPVAGLEYTFIKRFIDQLLSK